MEKHPPLPMTPFDMLTSSTQLQMMKLMLPYTPPGIQRMLAFYIKFLELKKTAEYFGLFGSVSRGILSLNLLLLSRKFWKM